MSTIPLAKGFKPEKLDYPVLLSRKYDGVPVRIDITGPGEFSVQSRQGKDVPSVTTLVQQFVTEVQKWIDGVPMILVGEVVQYDNPSAPFKDTSGIVRKQTDQSDKLVIVLFECNGEIADEFEDRYDWMHENLQGLHPRVEVVYQHTVHSADELDALAASVMKSNPDWEGLVARSHNDRWQPGKRSWGYQKVLNEPTIDLRIVGFEEAVDKHGAPMGMVGRLIASYKGGEIGIGPGKLTHAERKELWRGYKLGMDTDMLGLAEIKYKADDSYDALRQPTFQHWRDDKSEPDA